MTDGRRNIRTTTPTKVPGLPKPPANIDRSLRDYLVACGEALEIRLGRKGDVRDRAVTLRELIDLSLIHIYEPTRPERIGYCGLWG